MNPEDVKAALTAGLLSFPVTPFTSEGHLALDPLGSHLNWLSGFGASALFVAGGTGEGFSLTTDEVAEVTRAAKAAAGKTPIVAGVGHGTALAMATARAAQAAGADALLILPPYLMLPSQKGLADHYSRILETVDIGVILYARERISISPDTLERLSEKYPHLIGYKDGVGDIGALRRITSTLGNRLAHIGGMPTAEVFAEGYAAVGVPTYSSAVFNFMPEFAVAFYDALRAGNRDFVERGLARVFYPFIDLRDRSPGYAISAIKAGVRKQGFAVGPVRPPLTELTSDEDAELGRIVEMARQMLV